MKRITVTAIIILILVSWAWAVDMSFTIAFTIPSQHLQEVKTCYLESRPVPVELSDPNDPNSLIIPTMSDKAWILGNAKAAAMEEIRLHYNRGKSQIEQRARLKRKDMFLE